MIEELRGFERVVNVVTLAPKAKLKKLESGIELFWPKWAKRGFGEMVTLIVIA
ncbi:MAG TPA: hypothetical protein VGG85_02410 [Terracidiphilus sp.]|jgi:hypothetical protein